METQTTQITQTGSTIINANITKHYDADDYVFKASISVMYDRIENVSISAIPKTQMSIQQSAVNAQGDEFYARHEWNATGQKSYHYARIVPLDESLKLARIFDLAMANALGVNLAAVNEAVVIDVPLIPEQ